MSAHSSASVQLTPEQLHYLETVPQFIPEMEPITAPLALALSAAGLHKKAVRANECGMTCWLRCDSACYAERETRTCRIRYCKCCAPIIRQERVDNFWANQPYMRNLSQFHVIELAAPCVADPCGDCIQSFARQCRDWLKRLEDPRSGTGSSHNLVLRPEYTTSSTVPDMHVMVAKVLWWGDLPTSAPAFRDCPMKMRWATHAAADLPAQLNYVFDVEPPSDPALQAKYEIAFHGIRNVRHMGKMVHKDLLTPEETFDMVPSVAKETQTEEALIAGEGTSANNDPSSPLPTPSPTHSPHKKCRICHRPLTQRSQWVPPGQSPRDLNELAWFPEVRRQ